MTSKPFDYFSTLVASRIQEGNYVSKGPGIVETTDEDGEAIEMRHISAFLPLSIGGNVISSVFGLDQVLSLVLALYHFNNRIASIVPELGRLSDCNIKFTLDTFDTQYSPTTASRSLVHSILSRMDSQNITESRQWPTALLGPFLGKVAEPLASIGGVFGLTQVSHMAVSAPLELRKDQYPYFGRIHTAWSEFQLGPATVFFVSVLKSTHVFYLVDTPQSWERDFFRGALDKGIRVESAFLSQFSDDLSDAIDKALDRLERSQIRHVYCIVFEQVFKIMIPKIVERGLYGAEYVWVVAGTVFTGWQVSPGGPIAEFINGTALPLMSAGAVLPGYDAFNSEFLRFHDSLRPSMTRLLPSQVTSLPSWESYEVPASAPSSIIHLYDAFMSLGLAACEQQRKNQTSDTFYSTWLDNSFEGAAGKVKFNGYGSREPETVTAGMSIYRLVPNDDEEGTMTVSPVVTYTYKKKTDNALQQTPFTKIQNIPFTLPNWTRDPPLSIPAVEIFEEGIDTWSLVIGNIAFACVLLCSFGFGAWVWWFRKHEVVISAQPLFVYLIAFGVILMALSIIPLSVVDTSEHADVACMAGPWLTSLGFTVAFAALFSKLKRINTLYKISKSFRKVVVTPVQVLKPFVALVSVNMVVLIAWTAISPLKYESEATSYDQFGRPSKLTFACRSDNQITFGVVLALVNSVACIYAIYQAYLARQLGSKFSETESIYISLLISAQSYLIGAPAIAAADVVGASPTQSYLTRVFVLLWGCLGLILPLFVSMISRKRGWTKEQKRKERRRAERIQRNNAFFARSRDFVRRRFSSVKSKHRSSSIVVGKLPVVSRHSVSRQTNSTANMTSSVPREGLIDCSDVVERDHTR